MVSQTFIDGVKQDIAAGITAGKAAARPFDLSAGELLIEASTYFESEAKFDGWVTRNLDLTPKRARSLMYLAAREARRVA